MIPSLKTEVETQTFKAAGTEGLEISKLLLRKFSVHGVQNSAYVYLDYAPSNKPSIQITLTFFFFPNLCSEMSKSVKCEGKKKNTQIDTSMSHKAH